jgi:hypothetical protein
MNNLRVMNTGSGFDSPAGTIDSIRLNPVLARSAYPLRIFSPFLPAKMMQKKVLISYRESNPGPSTVARK